MGGSSPSPSQISGQVPIPPNQGAAAQAYQDLVNRYFLPASTSNLSGVGNPPASYYPQAQSIADFNLINPAQADRARSGAEDASNLYRSLYPYISNALPGLNDATLIDIGNADALRTNAFDPRYSGIVDAIQQNPYFGQALSGAQDASSLYARLFPQSVEQLAALRSGAGSALAGVPTALANANDPLYKAIVSGISTDPYGTFAQQLAGARTGAGYGASGAAAMAGAGQQLLNTGFDPQQSLFDRSQQQALDYANVANSMSGVGTTPYGASVTANALNNFNLNWQDRQLARQAQAAQAASPLLTGAPTLAAGAAGLPNQAILGQYRAALDALRARQQAQSQGAIAAGTLLGAGQGATAAGQDIAARTGQNVAALSGLPSNIYTANQDALARALTQRNLAGAQGTGAFSNLIGAAGTGLTTGSNLTNQLAQNLASTSGLPYNTGVGIGQNALAGIGNVSNLGLSAYNLPETVINQLAAYQRLGQAAAGRQADLNQLGFSQTASGVGGLLSGANLLFNPQSGILSGGAPPITGFSSPSEGGGGPIGGNDFNSFFNVSPAQAASASGGNFLSAIPIIGPLASGIASSI